MDDPNANISNRMSVRSNLGLISIYATITIMTNGMIADIDMAPDDGAKKK